MGNFEYDTRQSDLERLFGKYGKIERVDMKSGKHSCCLILMLLHSISLSRHIFRRNCLVIYDHLSLRWAETFYS